MKRLFYLSGSLCFLALTLLIGMHIASRQATAESPLSQVALVGSGDWGIVILTEAGDVWELIGGNERRWEHNPWHPLPVPVGEIYAIGGQALVTKTGEGYGWSSGSWTSAGSVPGWGTPIESTTWGQLKQRFVK